MDLPPIPSILAVDVFVFGFADQQADVVALTDVPAADAVVGLDEGFGGDYSGGVSVKAMIVRSCYMGEPLKLDLPRDEFVRRGHLEVM